ncbi:2-amino-4-hydroxy-6-hydroxymethyldihydropteridine diphosphokinase [Facklamia sp. DSM 111018]|uniref:2-amino-4-hydroxy-6-hydroxymethyldihydropteridine diphosphokinase n=1 Tax=Facklamia lactis TaxID=2749967 RepID=A0ABS0LN36_9LACT|nr:2-amino-4-hydroxy-6-hydroxymethyldihydropteridine diphosphokinase [Facklamia lactis]MBG9979783.1 2-amino-4-hydroxy-6-hydroxymethyldihydropteridine diphosphokinase [Facklamia lactis]MBG9985537.1 2-amino-4-hydroxy-6-hydroxymethyldihydropteridine diphosphokinase [Facklamia lactis]
MEHSVYLSLGSNLGDRFENLSQGQQRLAAHPQIVVQKVSAYYQTSPVGGVVQDDFINQAMLIQTSLSGEELLDYIHEIEAELLRKRVIIWGPRTLDIDILFYDELESDHPDLTLPHPEVFNRLFVLIPLQEIMEKDFIHTEAITEAIAKLEATTDQRIERVDKNDRIKP